MFVTIPVTPRFNRPFRVVALAALTLSSCASTVTAVNTTDPTLFARNLFAIADRGNAREWGKQLTKERRDMGEKYVADHFDIWRKTLTELANSFDAGLENVPFEVRNGHLSFYYEEKWHELFLVTTEDGGLRINQD